MNPPAINPERNSTANGRRLEHEPRMDANKSGGEFLQWLYQLLRKTVCASTETALDVIFCVSIRVYSRAFAVEYLALVSLKSFLFVPRSSFGLLPSFAGAETVIHECCGARGTESPSPRTDPDSVGYRRLGNPRVCSVCFRKKYNSDR